MFQPHDKEPAHKALATKTALRDCGFEELSHPPYFPQLAPCDFHLFPKLKGHLLEKHLEDDNKLNTVTVEWLKGQYRALYLMA